MKKILFCLLLLSQSAMATCFMERITCHPAARFQNIYEIESVSCSPPGGPVTKTEKLNIYNELVSTCGPVHRRGCLKPILSRELNLTRHMFLQAEIRIDRFGNFLRIDDRRTLRQGEFHISTPNAGYMQLVDYRCARYNQ